MGTVITGRASRPLGGAGGGPGPARGYSGWTVAVTLLSAGFEPVLVIAAVFRARSRVRDTGVLLAVSNDACRWP